uniref:Uncharacterized protein n=1 Tax=Equus asinus TaxID=9793 RepID=A0A8C4PTH5_EQUAS
MQIKATMRYHLMPIRTAITKKTRNIKYLQGCGEKRTLVHCWWECKLVQTLWKTVRKFLKKLRTEIPYDSAIPLLDHQKQHSSSKSNFVRLPTRRENTASLES